MSVQELESYVLQKGEKRKKGTVVSRKKIYCVASPKIVLRDRTISHGWSISLYLLFGQTVSCAHNTKEKEWQDQTINSRKNVLLRRISRDLKYLSEIEQIIRKGSVNLDH
jgi:hypothetical protein